MYVYVCMYVCMCVSMYVCISTVNSSHMYPGFDLTYVCKPTPQRWRFVDTPRYCVQVYWLALTTRLSLSVPFNSQINPKVDLLATKTSGVDTRYSGQANSICFY